MASPCLEIREVKTEPAGDGAFRIRLVVMNSGWLPTNVTKNALNRKLCRGVVGEILREGESTEYQGTSEPDWLLSGQLREDAGQLTGWSHITAGGFAWGFDETSDLAVFQWVAKPGVYNLLAKHERAGTVRRRLEVG